MPWRCAASSFSFRPPIGSTLPRSVISPVMATSPRTGILVSALQMVVAMVMPAEGPSLGMAPSGNVQVNVEIAVEIARQPELMRPRADVAHRRLRRFLHHVAQLAGDGQLALAFHQGALRWSGSGRPLRSRPARSPRRLRSSSRPPDRGIFQGPSSSGSFSPLITALAFGFLSLLALAVHHLARDLAADVADLALQVADAGFARVVLDQPVRCPSSANSIWSFAQPGLLPSACGPGSAWRSPSSRARCSPRAGSLPCGPASAGGMVCSTLAVAMKKTWLRSYSTSR